MPNPNDVFVAPTAYNPENNVELITQADIDKAENDLNLLINNKATLLKDYKTALKAYIC